MDWTMIITFILQIVMAFLNGNFNFDNLFPTPTPAARVASMHKCYSPQWTSNPKVVSNVFTGTIEVVCEIQTDGQGSIADLQAQLEGAAVTSSNIRLDGAQPVSFGRLDGVSHTATLVANKTVVRGSTELVSDGSTELRRSFSVSGKDARAVHSLLQSAKTDVEVSSSLSPGYYRVVFTMSAGIEKPLLIAASRFATALKAQFEERARKEAEAAIKNLGNAL